MPDRITGNSEPHSHPVNSKKSITEREWEIAIGIRCAKCKQLTEKCTCKK